MGADSNDRPEGAATAPGPRAEAAGAAAGRLGVRRSHGGRRDGAGRACHQRRDVLLARW